LKIPFSKSITNIVLGVLFLFLKIYNLYKKPVLLLVDIDEPSKIQMGFLFYFINPQTSLHYPLSYILDNC
jgi:hypothetical protein